MTTTEEHGTTRNREEHGTARIRSRGHSWLRPAAAGVAVAAALALTACSHQPPPIRVEGRTLVVENQSQIEWRNVTVTLNSYYRGGAASLAPGGRLEAGLSNFVTGLGQRFNPLREGVRTVQVRATDASGKPVALDYPDTKLK